MPKSILVIDDEESVRNSFMLALEDSGYQIKTADCGEQGIAYFGEDDYNLVFLDLKMPGISGVETLEQIRKMDAAVPIYIVTAFHKEFLQGLNEAKEKGLSFEIIKKPIGIDQIQLITEAILNSDVATYD